MPCRVAGRHRRRIGYPVSLLRLPRKNENANPYPIRHRALSSLVMDG